MMAASRPLNGPSAPAKGGDAEEEFIGESLHALRVVGQVVSD